jgi:hypothetical protein
VVNISCCIPPPPYYSPPLFPNSLIPLPSSFPRISILIFFLKRLSKHENEKLNKKTRLQIIGH